MSFLKPFILILVVAGWSLGILSGNVAFAFEPKASPPIETHRQGFDGISPELFRPVTGQPQILWESWVASREEAHAEVVDEVTRSRLERAKQVEVPPEIQEYLNGDIEVFGELHEHR